jgi:hypothetical protein
MTELGYRLIVPPGWVRIPLHDDPQAAIDRILETSFAGLPRDEVWPARRDLRAQLLDQIKTARDNEGVDLYLPVERVHGVTIPASFVVAILPFATAEEPQAEDVLAAYVAGTDNAEVTELDGSPAARTQTVAPGVTGAEDGSQFPSTRINYLVRLPVEADTWMTISFSTIGDGTPGSDFTTMMIALFDAIVGTLRWTR